MNQKLGGSKVTKTFQITVPGKARRILEIEPGDFVVFFEDEKTHKIYLRPAKLVLK